MRRGESLLPRFNSVATLPIDCREDGAVDHACNDGSRNAAAGRPELRKTWSDTSWKENGSEEPLAWNQTESRQDGHGHKAVSCHLMTTACFPDRVIEV